MNVQVKFNMIIQYMFSMHYEYDGLCIKLFTFIQYAFMTIMQLRMYVKTGNN